MRHRSSWNVKHEIKIGGRKHVKKPRAFNVIIREKEKWKKFGDVEVAVREIWNKYYVRNL